MELVIQGYRKARGLSEPAFQLVLDRDVVLDHEIGDEFWVKEGSQTGSAEIGRRGGGRTVAEGLELVDMPANGRPAGGDQAVGELDGRDASLHGEGGSASVSVES